MAYDFSIDRDRIRRERAVAELRRTAAERDPAGFDPRLDLSARAQTGGGQQLLQPLSPRISRWFRWRPAAAARTPRSGGPLPWREWAQGRGSWRFLQAAAALPASAGRGHRGTGGSSRTRPA